MINFQQVLIDAGYNPRSYSGRGMYGKECLGVTLGDESEFSFIGKIMREIPVDYDPNDEGAGLEAYENTVDELADIIEDTKTDSIGRGIIVYWPNITFDAK